MDCMRGQILPGAVSLAPGAARWCRPDESRRARHFLRFALPVMEGKALLFKYRAA